MSSSDTSRGPKTDSAPTRDRDWKAREVAPHLAGAPQQSQPELSASGGGSLRSRISDKEGPRSLAPAPAPAPANLYRSEPPQKDDDRDSNRKRTVSGARLINICDTVFTH
jgi:THO complex subunit 2